MGCDFQKGVRTMIAAAEEIIRERAHARVAQLFGLAPDAMQPGAEFGKELKASFVSDFRHNEFDKLDQDIKDVADQATKKRLASGELVIRTVADYVDHMVACYATNPREVVRLLGLEVARSGAQAG